MSTTGWTRTRSAERLEDLDWLDQAGESAAEAAARFGIDYDALEKWARRHDRDRWARMSARNPLPIGGHSGRRLASP